jgi:hypothetical protein
MTAINFRSRFVRSLPITASLALTDANTGRGRRCYAWECCGPSVADHVKLVATLDFHGNEGVEVT